MIEEYEGEPALCSVCGTFLSARVIFGELVCYDCALYYTEEFFTDYLQRVMRKVKKMSELYEKGVEDLKKEHEYQYNNLATAFKQYMDDIANEKPKRRKTKKA